MQGVRTADLVAAFRHDPDARFGADYIEQLRSLDISSRGFLTGSIDLVFSDGSDLQQARWWVADWKSNWIGERVSDAGISLCGPRHYDAGAMHAQMLHHHYPCRPIFISLPCIAICNGDCRVMCRNAISVDTSMCFCVACLETAECPPLVLARAGLWSERHWLAFVRLISC